MVCPTLAPVGEPRSPVRPDFDSPDAFDYDILRECIEDLKASRAVQAGFGRPCSHELES